MVHRYSDGGAGTDRIEYSDFFISVIKQHNRRYHQSQELRPGQWLCGDAIRYGTGGALWAGVAKGEVNVAQMSPFQLQRMRADGVPIRIIGTVVRLRTLQVITKNPEIKKFIDLKGRTFAATVGLAEFDYLQIYAKKLDSI